MEVKPSQHIVLNVALNDRDYRMIVPTNAPLGELYDAIHSMLQHITSSAAKATEASKRPEPNAEAS